MNSGIN